MSEPTDYELLRLALVNAAECAHLPHHRALMEQASDAIAHQAADLLLLRSERDALKAELAKENTARQLVADILAEYADDYGKEASGNCPDCGPMVSCCFHSILSLLSMETWTTPEIYRETRRSLRLKVQLQEAESARDALLTSQKTLQTQIRALVAACRSDSGIDESITRRLAAFLPETEPTT